MGEFIIPIPHVKQVKVLTLPPLTMIRYPISMVYGAKLILFGGYQLSNAGGRLIIASDGIWDALSSDIAAQSCRGLPAELAAKLVVKVFFIL